ncbi:MAG: amino acid ABC transporter substrate-binding protein [Propionivibrio sp.]|uniref:amino acid ABC transporter substrate-binding protein n=1 Tax=Propionivibrio sp. TaxID=2212460 RepID=UPI001A57C710|nr:amino acid ABC transporter substrate-binding protein [Propionivibrio sp.]MBL8416234.1 amino acid ABC transporter substrate-binding protein [Propionivibrio sp.]
MLKNGFLATLVCAMWLSVTADASALDIKQLFPTQYTGTLKKIKDSGIIRIGHRENSPPFAFLDLKGKPVGYSLDLCNAVVEEIADELNKEIRVEYLPVTPENRLDLVTSGTVDLECGSTTNTFERRKRVAFSPTIFVTGIKLLVRQPSKVRSLRDLQGKTVVFTRGTVHAEWMPKLAERQKLAITFVSGADHDESFGILASGKADAFANDDVQLYGMIAETRTNKQYRVVGDFLTYADYALMFRKDDPQFAEVVERTFTKLSGTRTISAIYHKWFIGPLPSGVRLNMPMSPHMEELFKVQGLQGD